MSSCFCILCILLESTNTWQRDYWWKLDFSGYSYFVLLNTAVMLYPTCWLMHFAGTLLCHIPIIDSLLASWRHHAHHNSIYRITTHGGESPNRHMAFHLNITAFTKSLTRMMTPNALESWALFGWAAFNRPWHAAQAGGGAAPDSSTTSKSKWFAGENESHLPLLCDLRTPAAATI